MFAAESPTIAMPPASDSAMTVVKEQWRIIQTSKSRNFLPAPHIRHVEIFLERRSNQIDSGVLGNSFDWAADLFMAGVFHKHNLDWFDKINSEHSAYIDFWKTTCANAIDNGNKLSLAGINTIYLVHGAVAVGSLNALASKTAVPDIHVAAAAKFAMPSALVGIGLVSLGQILVAKFGLHMAWVVSGKLVGSVAISKARALPKYWSKMHNRFLSKGDYLIYSSVIWFFVYSLISYIVLISS